TVCRKATSEIIKKGLEVLPVIYVKKVISETPSGREVPKWVNQYLSFFAEKCQDIIYKINTNDAIRKKTSNNNTTKNPSIIEVDSFDTNNINVNI
ncbi:hypothetical protein B9K06_26315, partial [Bacillus sp. OG2]